MVWIWMPICIRNQNVYKFGTGTAVNRYGSTTLDRSTVPYSPRASLERICWSVYLPAGPVVQSDYDGLGREPDRHSQFGRLDKRPGSSYFLFSRYSDCFCGTTFFFFFYIDILFVNLRGRSFLMLWDKSPVALISFFHYDLLVWAKVWKHSCLCNIP